MYSNPAALYRKAKFDSAPSGKDVEASVLELATAKLRVFTTPTGDAALRWSPQFGEALEFNQKIWDVLIADWSSEESTLDVAMRQNLLSLAVFVKKRTFQLMSQPDRAALKPLLQINDMLVEGLRRGAEKYDGETQPTLDT